MTNENSNTVSVISAANNTVVQTVTVGNNPGGIAITPNGAFVYVANLGDGTVSVIDTANNAVTDTVLVGGLRGFVAISPNGAFVYVTGFSGSFPGTVAVTRVPG